MILQALYDYAQRKGDVLPEDGFEDVEIKYLIKIREDGSLVDLISTVEGKKGHVYEKVPMRVSRSGKTPKASLLLDNVGYVLLDEAKREAFIRLIENLPDEVKSMKEINAVLAFYRENRANGLDKVASSELWEECQKTTGYLSFQLEGAEKIVPQIDAVREYQRKLTAQNSESDDDDFSEKSVNGICLITGEKSTISRLHHGTPIIGAKSNPKLVSFQKGSGYDSYGKQQSYNAPVSVKAELAYTKALKYLINSKDNHFILGGNPKDKEKKKECNTIVFWAEKNEAEPFEPLFGLPFATNFDDPDRDVQEVKNLLSAPFIGKLEVIDSNFYVLCLSPNAARISVRFWETGKVAEFAKRIKQHFDDFEIVRAPYESEYLNLYQILCATTRSTEAKPNGNIEDVVPNLIGSVMQSILKGVPYPTTLQQQCIRRIRAEKDYKDDSGKWHYKVTRARAAILKAYINRLNRQKNIQEVSVVLDKNCAGIGYLLGRLFAVYEKVQQDTHPNLNATITDRFYGAASTNPVTVFTQLNRLNQHHLANYENKGLRTVREKEIGEIMDKIDSFPAHLDLNAQSMFAIGYYHEKQSFFNKTENLEKSEGEN